MFDQEKFEEDWQTLEAGFQRLLEAVESGFVKVRPNSNPNADLNFGFKLGPLAS